MAYCTQADIELRISAADLVTLADQDGDGVSDPAVVTQAIEDACGWMDSYLQMKFVVPVPPPIPKVLRDIAVALSICRLKSGRDSLTEDAKRVCDDAQKWLLDIASGKSEIGLAPKPAESAGAGGVRHEEQPRKFGRTEFL